MGAFLYRQVAIPFITAIAGYGHQAAPVAADGRNTHCLPADLACFVGPDHVFPGDMAVLASLAELLPGFALVHAQGSQVGGTADFQPAAANRAGPFHCFILEHDGAMAGIAEGYPLRCGPFHEDSIIDDLHFFPFPLVAVEIGVIGMGFIYEEVFGIGAEDGQPPSPVLVMADGNPRDGRLSPTDDVPAGGDQVGHVAQRRRRKRPMRVVGQHRVCALGVFAGDDPVVATNDLLSNALLGFPLLFCFQGEGVVGFPGVAQVSGYQVFGAELQGAAEGVVGF